MAEGASERLTQVSSSRESVVDAAECAEGCGAAGEGGSGTIVEMNSRISRTSVSRPAAIR